MESPVTGHQTFKERMYHAAFLPANQLMSLSQNGHPLEEYVWEFCELDCFHVHLDEPLYSLMPLNTGNCILEQYILHAVLLKMSKLHMGSKSTLDPKLSQASAMPLMDYMPEPPADSKPVPATKPCQNHVAWAKCSLSR